MANEVKKYEHIEELDKYFEDVKRYRKRLTREEEITLAKQIKEGNEEAFNKLIKHNLRFASVRISPWIRSFRTTSSSIILPAMGTAMPAISTVATRSLRPTGPTTASTWRPSSAPT